MVIKVIIKKNSKRSNTKDNLRQSAIKRKHYLGHDLKRCILNPPQKNQVMGLFRWMAEPVPTLRRQAVFITGVLSLQLRQGHELVCSEAGNADNDVLRFTRSEM